jgi:hypothetical protein
MSIERRHLEVLLPRPSLRPHDISESDSTMVPRFMRYLYPTGRIVRWDQGGTRQSGPSSTGSMAPRRGKFSVLTTGRPGMTCLPSH